MCLIIFVDLFMPVQGCGRTQSLTTEAAHILLCSAFVHFLVLHECSLRGIFLWTFIASELFLCLWCLFGAILILFCPGNWEYVSVGFVCCKMSHHTLDTPRGSAGHGPPACATRPCTAHHSQMGGHQLRLCPFMLGPVVLVDCAFVIAFGFFYHTQNMPMPVQHVVSHVS